jgi:hypothetical protein
MKYLLTISLLFISILAYCQQGNYITLKLKTGLEVEVKVLSMEKKKITIEKENRTTSTINAEVIESIDGMSYDEFYDNFDEGSLSTSMFPLNADGEIEFTEVVQVDGVNADELFIRAREWLALTFVSSVCIPAKLPPYSGQIDPLDTRLDFGQRA